MIENEQSRKISNEELDRDIRNTEIEGEAYGELASGYAKLAMMPENDAMTTRLHNANAEKFKKLQAECANLLKTLLALKEERSHA